MDTDTETAADDISDNRPNAWRQNGEFADRYDTHPQTSETESNPSSVKNQNTNRSTEHISPVSTAQAVQKMCRENSNVHSTFFSSDKLNHFILDRKRNFAVCYTPKSGSTYWKRVLYLLNQNNSDSLTMADFKNVSKIDIHATHDIPWLYKLFPDFSHAVSFLRNATKALFVRHPYVRIFSAYIDKIFLSSLWQNVALSIIKQFRVNATSLSLKCGHDVTFTEFLRYVIHVNEDNMKSSFPAYDDHWYAISTFCDPCQVNFDFIGYVEKFSEDVQFISDRLNITSFTHYPGPSNATDSALEYFAERIEQEFSENHHSDTVMCISENDIFHRIWKAFQMQGYISVNAELDTQKFNSLENISSRIIRFREQFIEELAKTSSSMRRILKTEALARAYSDVPVSVKQGLKDVFKRDFILFGYDEHPAYI